MPEHIKPKKGAAPDIIGWREWLSLPELGIKKVKVKIDTGARTSSLHAYDIEEVHKGKKVYVHFKVHPLQRDTQKVVSCQAELVEYRNVTNSGGKVTRRPVIKTLAKIKDHFWEIEITLINRDEMGFRMLLGRQAIRGNFLINPAKSFCASK